MNSSIFISSQTRTSKIKLERSQVKFQVKFELATIVTQLNYNNCTLVNVLSACAHLGALGQGEWIHAFIDKNEIGTNGFVATALVDILKMWEHWKGSKCVYKCFTEGYQYMEFHNCWFRDAWL